MSKESAPSTICYIEIPAPDIEKAGSFYSSVFGWKITPSSLTDKEYWEFSTGEGQISGGLDSSKPAIAEGIMLYLKVEDIDSTLNKVKTSGGSVLRAKFDIGGGHGWSAMFSDTNGNTLGLISNR